MNRRNFVKSATLAPLLASLEPCLALHASPDETAKLRKTRIWPDGEEPIHARYEVTLQRVLAGGSPAYTEEFLLEDVRPTKGRRFTEFSGDVSGRYIGALATAARVHHTNFPGLDALVEKTIALQKPDGYFGSGFHYDKPTDDDLALLWGNGRLLVGLLEYYRLVTSAPVLRACTRLGDWLARIGPLMLSKEIRDAFGAQHFASSYICWTQQVEGLANLYKVTRNERHRKLAEEIVSVTERRAGDHVHGYLTSVRGWVDLYEATGDGELLRKCEAAWKDVAESQDLLITGGVPEGWSPNNHRTEGCGEADWLRLSLALWKATGKTQYLEMAERTLFNEFAFNQYETGDFGHRAYTETELPAAGAVRAWWCCTLHGLRCYPEIQGSAFLEGSDGTSHELSYDLPVDGFVRTEALSATSVSSLAEDGTIRIKITSVQGSPGREPIPLRIRKPVWADSIAVRVHDREGDGERLTKVENGYLRVSRAWQAGDSVTVQYGMSLRAMPSGKDRVSYFYGPWLLGAPAAENPAYFNELTAWNRLTVVQPKSAEGFNSPPGRFSVPVAATRFGYVPAEFPEQPGTVMLRALAEQTGQPTTSWQIRFLASGPANS